MESIFHLGQVIDSPSKVAILRILASRKGFKGTGCDIAQRAGYSVPSTHESLKSLHSRNIVNLEIIGKQHIYSLNEEDRIVKKIIRPMFDAEGNIKQEIGDFLLKGMKKEGIKRKIVSLILYGSIHKGTVNKNSDVDVAVVITKKTDTGRIVDVFNGSILSEFKSYFGMHLDPYIKAAVDFRDRREKYLPPVSTLMKSYSVLYGKEPLDI